MAWVFAVYPAKGGGSSDASHGAAGPLRWDKRGAGGMLAGMGEAAEKRRRVDYATYVALEREADHKHEWFDGKVYAMAGGTISHGEISGAMVAVLRAAAQKCGCRVFTSDVKVRVLATGLATYPDVSVVCGPVERDPEDRHTIANPAVLVEVLSDSREAYDRGQKFANYRKIPSLKHYVLVSQHERHIEVYSRNDEGAWVLREARSGGSVALAALQGELAVDAIYEGVELEPAPPMPER